ncbi:MAG: helix-turn-helix domain-containing protein [Filifactoraceae bacterium]
MKKAKLIKQMINDSGMSLKTFAIKADLPYTTLYSMLERGISKASVCNAIKICKVLNISVEQLDDISNGIQNHKHLTFIINDDFSTLEKRDILEYINFIKHKRELQ